MAPIPAMLGGSDDTRFPECGIAFDWPSLPPSAEGEFDNLQDVTIREGLMHSQMCVVYLPPVLHSRLS